MPRAQVREVSAPSEIRGVASPVNTYVRPADPDRSPLHELAQGLSALDEGMSAFLDKRTKEQNDLDKQRGIAAFNRSNHTAWGEAVRQGLVPPNASPVFMEWYKKSQGNVQGLKLRDKFAIEYQQWDGRNSGDPGAFEQFVGSFLKNNLGEENDPHVLAGLNPHVDSLFTESFDRFNRERADTVYSGAVGTQGSLIISTIDGLESQGKTSETGTDYEAMWSSITALREEALTTGVLAKDYDGMIVDSIILEAERTNNTELLQLLERKLPDAEHPMSYDIKVREKRDRALDNIGNAQARQETTNAAAREKLEKQQQEQRWAEVVRVLAEDHNADVPEEIITELSRRDGDARAKIAQYRRQFADAGVLEDPSAISLVFRDIHEGATERDVLQMFDQGVIRTTETLNLALDRVEKLRKANADGRGVMGHQTAKRWQSIIQNQLGAGEFDLLGIKGLNDVSNQAMIDFDMMLLDWEERNPDATAIEREKAINEAGALIRQRIEGGGDGDAGRYKTPDGSTLQFRDGEVIHANPASRQDQPEVLPAEATPAQHPEEVEVEDGGIIDGIKSFFGFGDEESQDQDPTSSAVNALAKKYGLDPAEARRMFDERMQSLTDEDPGVDNTITNSIPEDQRSNLQNLLRNPPKLADGSSSAGNAPVEPLLSLVGHTEGTDRGDGYNETLGYGAYTGGDVDLVNMTLGEIDKLQTQMLRHPDNKWDSSAIGRYQIIRTTLRGLKKELGLTDDMKFDKKLQDRLAMHLLERRGLSKWLSGKMTDEKFMTGLSQEWASLPRADGRGSYKGQRVGTSVAGLRSALGKVRKGGTQVASLGGTEGLTPKAYSKLPVTDSRGEDQIAKFIEWNDDPVANHEDNLRSIKPDLQKVVKRAQELSQIKFVIGSGKRDAELQKKAVKWGWSKTQDSDHLHGGAVDLWPLDEDGAVVFDKKLQTQIVKAMREAANELGVKLDIGADWKSFKDLPHFAIKS
ncbi:Muramidase (phage lambda lysozyme) [Nitratireductor aquibiodomus]|uniref:Muramidase (Phage lambda lysozyme) n=1 Tax=Nitratireductor aquibiodomus TaxID=204799 RepID=A0A1H4K8D6_9HYPH|nr:M15 family metallopeptidase [Nitratireductor aquibiodomus]SEB54556.1 Muramidase (phage lambda lysozyme) [Nitratireductor aquibiodomus]